MPDFNDIVSSLFAALGAVVLGGGGFAAVGFLLFRTFGEKWLDTKFEERLAAYKHAQQTELEHLRFEINKLMDRTLKLHQREFDVLPEAWSLFNDAFWNINHTVSGLKTYPDIDRMSEDEIEGLLERSSMSSSEKSKLKESSNKTEYYIKNYARWNEISNARKAFGLWENYFLKNGIFIADEVKGNFGSLSDLIKGALIEHQIREEDKGLKLSECKDFLRFVKEGRKLRDELETEVKRRLWDSAKQTAASR